MKAVQLVAQRVLEPRVVEGPRDPGPGEVLVKLRAVGICGSDLHWYLDGGIGAMRAAYPMTLGHEPVGTVEAVGPGVESHRPGERVSVEPSITCGHCEFCMAGRPNNCVHGVFMGGPSHPGFLREYAVVPARNADHAPDGMSWDEAALIEPAAVLSHVMELTTIPLGATVAVLGCGPIGLLAIAFAKMAGASRIVALDRVPHRLRMAERAGAAETASTIEAVLDLTRGRGADVTFDAAGDPETIGLAIQCTRPSGQFVLIGIPGVRNFPIDIHAAMMKELRIQTVKRSNHRGAHAIQLLEARRLPDFLITHRFPLERTPEAFELLAGYRDGVGKVLVEM